MFKFKFMQNYLDTAITATAPAHNVTYLNTIYWTGITVTSAIFWNIYSR